MLAKGTGLDAVDLELFWRALLDMFEHDRSAARGDMRLRQVFVFRHEDPLGNAHAGALFDRVKAIRKSEIEVARAYEHYDLHVADTDLPEGVSLFKALSNTGATVHDNAD
jgi:CRISPR-associated protein Csd2